MLATRGFDPFPPVLVALLAGCTAAAPATDGVASHELAISRVDVLETAERTSIVASGAGGEVLARLDLVHGEFTLSDAFADGAADRRVAGRRLEVSALDQTMRWETEGFTPTLRMPAHPASQWAIAAFLSDARVRPILERWQIGFEPGPASPGRDGAYPDSAPPGYDCRANGTHPRDCSGNPDNKCPTMFATRPAPNLCGNVPGVVSAAWIVHQRGVDWAGMDGEAELLGNGYFFNGARTQYDQSLIAECCRATPTRTPFFEIKSCPDPCGADLCPSTCGATAFGACKACPLYVTDKCSIAIVEAGWLDPHAPHDLVQPSGDDKLVRDVCARIAWTCGDGICDVDETCDSCSADCTCSP